MAFLTVWKKSYCIKIAHHEHISIKSIHPLEKSCIRPCHEVSVFINAASCCNNSIIFLQCVIASASILIATMN